MIKRLLYIFAFISVISLTLSFYMFNPKDSYSILIQIVSVNGYGNNLYLDNFSFGKRLQRDLAVTSINNIPKDTTYLNSLYTYKISPKVNVTNLGREDISNDSIFMVVNSVSYFSRNAVGAITSGQTVVVTFDTLTIIPNTTYDIEVYINSTDTNRTNDTLSQTSVFLLGAYRNILVEEFTSATSPSCANNNPYLDAYLNSNYQYVCPVKYHLGIPAPAKDSMFFADSIQQKQRASYYYVYAVPTTFLDGKIRLPLPYSYDTNIIIPFYNRFIVGAPLSVDVSDTRLTGDTIQANININLLHTLASNNLRLRIYAIERSKLYSTAPGTNGETNFYDIFRAMYPDSAGIPISNIQGTYQYTYKYLKDTTWTDSLIYTLAFVQDDNTKEVLNCGKARQYAGKVKDIALQKPVDNKYSKADIGSVIPHKPFRRIIGRRDSTSTNFFMEGFEGPFPPYGWTIINSDVGFTFQQLYGYNGPSYGGVNCIKIPFYDYPNIGEKDTLISAEIPGITADDTLRFDYSYAQYLSSYIDSLVINISTDGGQSFNNIFREGGPYMATSQATTLSYAPTASSQWVSIIFPMSAILNLKPIQPVPSSYKLYQNYPNPFNPTTNIKFDLPNNVFVSVKIYDLLGREIKTLVNENMTAGQKTIPFTPVSLSSGIYFIRIVAGDFKDVKKMMYVK